MESLQPPQDPYSDVKMEPNSPPSEFASIINIEDPWLFEDNFAKDDIISPLEKFEDLSDQMSLAEGELFYELEFDFEPEQWIDGKPSIHQLVDNPDNLIPLQSCPTQAIKVQNSLEIFMELEKIYDVSELTQLTPPQTPPQESKEVKQMFELVNQESNFPLVANNDIDNIIPVMSPSNSDYSSDTGNNTSMPSDIAREMQIVDEILRTRAEELPDWTDDESLHSSSSASSSLSSSSCSASPSNDDEWTPSDVSLPATKKNSNGEKSQKKRPRPYGRPVEDKKSRKKEQNKNAATRYRQKKKLEMEEALEEERQLVTYNEELTKKLTDIEREVKYLKQLIREFHKSKKDAK